MDGMNRMDVAEPGPFPILSILSREYFPYTL